MTIPPVMYVVVGLSLIAVDVAYITTQDETCQ